MHEETKLKVKEIQKVHESQKGSDLGHHREFKSLTEILKKQREHEAKAQHRLEHIYGKEHPETHKYNLEEAERRKREAKKANLKHALDKYVSSANHNELIAQEIREAQAKQSSLGLKRDEVTDQLQLLSQQFEEQRLHHDALETYVKLDHFNAHQHAEDLRHKRIRWAGPDTYTVNDKAKTLKSLFSDPERVPYYD